MYHKYYINLEDQINILCKLINIIIKLDNQLYECRLEKNLKQKKYVSQGKSQFNRQSRNYQSYRESMELNIIKQYLRKKRFQRKWNSSFCKKEEIKYYDCEKIGYIK